MGTLKALFLLLATLAVTWQCEAIPTNGVTCMSKWLQLAIPDASQQAQIPVIEKLLSRLNPAVDAATIGRESEQLLAHVLGHNDNFFFNAPAVSYLRRCMGGNDSDCRRDAPCRNAGKCLYASLPSPGYACSCPDGFSGEFCQTGWLSVEQLSNITSSLATLGHDVTRLKQDMLNSKSEARTLLTRLETRLDSSLQGLQLEGRREQAQLRQELQAIKGDLGCSRAKLAYQYTTYRTSTDGMGQLASLTIRKTKASTLLKIDFSTIIRTRGGRSAARWFAKIDGQECASPNIIDMAHYRALSDDVHIPAHLAGVCRATSAGSIGAGNHVVTIHVGQNIGRNIFLAKTGWEGTSLLEVQEICPP